MLRNAGTPVRRIRGAKNKIRQRPNYFTASSVKAFGHAVGIAASLQFVVEGVKDKAYVLMIGESREAVLRAMGAIVEQLMSGEEAWELSTAHDEALSQVSAVLVVGDRLIVTPEGSANVYLVGGRVEEVPRSIYLPQDFRGHIYLSSSPIDERERRELLHLSRSAVFPDAIVDEYTQRSGLNALASLGIRLPIPNWGRDYLRRLKLYGASSDLGRRRTNNEDSVLASSFKYSSNGVTESSFILMVADGVGGSAYGEVASREALIEAYEEAIKSSPPNLGRERILGGLRKAVLRANERVLDVSRRMRAKSSTTLTMALVKEDQAYIAHCGDSRAYRLSDENIIQLTEDHKYVNELVKMGKITPEEARFHPQRNVITSALGMREPRIDLTDVPLRREEAMLLCSDGLTDLVEDREVWGLYRQYRYPSTTSKALTNLANLRGGFDNISIAMMVPAISLL